MEEITIGIIGNGPDELVPDLKRYKDHVDIWIGADRGALLLLQNGLAINYALGDFDSISKDERERIKSRAIHFESFSSEKNETDLELAIEKAFSLEPKTILLFGVTGGRIDHELINIQLLYAISNRGLKGIIIDKSNYIEWTKPGTHQVKNDPTYPFISFIPFTTEVTGITLNGFYYPLENEKIGLGSTRTISNKLTGENGTYSYERGILLLIKSRDLRPN